MTTLERSFGIVIPLDETLPPPHPAENEKPPEEIILLQQPDVASPSPKESTPTNETPQVIDNSSIEFNQERGGIFKIDVTKPQRLGFVLSNQALVEIADYVNANRDAIDAQIKEDKRQPAVTVYDSRRIEVTNRAKLDARQAKINQTTPPPQQ